MLSGAGPHDAVTRQALMLSSLLAERGAGGQVVAEHRDPRVGKAVGDASETLAALGPGDTVLAHYSAYSRYLPEALRRAGRGLMVFHNVTPPERLWEWGPMTAALCAAAQGQLPELAPLVSGAAAVSEFNACQLRSAGYGHVEVVPNVVPMPAAASPATRPPNQTAEVLFVGRLAPHKRPDALIQAVALLARRHGRRVRLRLVGSPVSAAFADAVGSLAAQLGVELVAESGLDDEALDRAYTDADVFCCLSEHEGFCIPIVEAMARGLPVVTSPAGGVPEVAGDAALVLDGSDPSAACEALELVLADADLRRELTRRGRDRAPRFAPEQVRPRWEAWLDRVLDPAVSTA